LLAPHAFSSSPVANASIVEIRKLRRYEVDSFAVDSETEVLDSYSTLGCASLCDRGIAPAARALGLAVIGIRMRCAHFTRRMLVL
jgi:hypothetical protein